MPETRTEKRGICGICPAGCWVVAEYDAEGRISRLRPDDDPDMGITCRLADNVRDIVYSPDRVLHPLRRKGPRGTYEFERISWEEAFDEIVKNLEKVKSKAGPEAAGIYTGVGSFEQAFCDIYQPADARVSSAASVLFPWGSPTTMGVGALCYVSYGMIAPHLTTGKMLVDMYNDVAQSDLIVVWGANPATDLPPVDMKRISEAANSGAEVVVIDPRRTATARITGGKWIPLRPGTDGALALGLCNVLIEEELIDEKFVETWTHGFDDFARYVQHFRPELVEDITGVPPDTLKWLARRLSSARGASQYMYTGLEYSNSGVQAIRAAMVLWALAGQLDVPGGRCFKMPGGNFPINRSGLVASPKGKRKLGDDRFPIYIKYRDEAHAIDLPNAVLSGKPHPVHALIVLGASMITSWPDPGLWKKTFDKLDFMAVVDRNLTADAAYADIVLPAATYFEIDSYMVYGPTFRLREKMIEPLGEARSDIFILAELARRLGYGHLYPQSVEELYDYVLDGSGYTVDQIRKNGGTVSLDTPLVQYTKWDMGLLRDDGRPGFDTPTGKLEISSTILDDYGYDPLPEYTEPRESPVSRPGLAERFPLVFNSGGRVRTSFHTQHHNVPGLKRERPEPTVMINDSDAKHRGISHGDMARISTPRGCVTMRAIVTENIAPGSIDANHACGGPVGPEAWSEPNINELTDLENHDPISGFPVYKCLLCEVELADRTSGGAKLDSGEITAEEIGAVPAAGPRKKIYCDFNSTTPISLSVKEAVTGFMEEYGNPSSVHAIGDSTRAAVDVARRKVAAAIGTTPRRITFTGSGSEANNLAIKGVALRALCSNAKPHFVSSAIEHSSVIRTYQWLEEMGADVTYVTPRTDGVVQPESFAVALRDNTVLASVMLANSETGVIQPVEELARLAHERGVPFHCDAVQGLGKIDVNIREADMDLLSISAHKIHGPKGIGALYTRKGLVLDALINGGGQEHGLRSGTENTLGIIGFGKAAEELPVLRKDMERIAVLRDRLERGLLEIYEDAAVNGADAQRLANTINITLPGVRGESVVTRMSRRGIYLSAGSACKAGSTKPSRALLAMGLMAEDAHCSVRLSLGADNTEEDIEMILETFNEVLKDSRNIIAFAPCR